MPIDACKTYDHILRIEVFHGTCISIMYYWSVNQILTSPAPWKRYVWSDTLVWHILIDAKTPATATEAVPVVRSLF